jgi:hypothetical protein
VAAALLFVRVPKQEALLKVIVITSLGMAVSSVLLFVGMASDQCQNGVKCSPRGVCAAVPSFISFVSAAGLFYGQGSHNVP